MKKTTALLLSCTAAISIENLNANAIPYTKIPGPVTCPQHDMPIHPAPLTTAFHGGFIGIQIGASNQRPKVQQTINAIKTHDKDTSTCVLTGALGGFNVRSNDFVFGIEAHAHKDFTKTEHTFATTKLKITPSYSLGVGLKLGIVVPDDTLLFIKGGVELTRLHFKEEISNTTFHHSATPFTLGLGVERKAGQLGLRLSYDYAYKSDSKTHKINDIDTDYVIKRPSHKVLAGVFFHF